jgi:hypothetical protein
MSTATPLLPLHAIMWTWKMLPLQLYYAHTWSFKCEMACNTTVQCTLLGRNRATHGIICSENMALSTDRNSLTVICKQKMADIGVLNLILC